MQVWQPKQQLQNGKFTIQKFLGGGGYGITYSAIDKNTNNIVAIKTLNPIHQSRADFEQMHVKFVQEAFRLVQCSHPHIVKVHEVINEGGLWGMVMEYIQGQDLAVYINERGKLPEEKALKYINQVGTALEYIHKQGLLHRDVKPNNVMLRQSQEEVVLIIIKILGKAGFGEVYLAQHSYSQEYVALKVMLPAVAANNWAVQMFLREMANTRALQHRNVVKLLDYSFSEGLFFFTMDFCNAGTAEDLLKKQGGKLPVDLAVPIILQVLDGLEYTHNAEIPYVKLNDGGFGKGKGLVHRDLKPGNIFLTRAKDEVIVKVGDYGLSKAFDLAGLSGHSMTGTKAGTPVFIPRQQVLEFKYAKPEVDVWAAAASLYYMLTREFPRDFSGNDIFLAVLRNDPVPIRDRDPNIPKKLAEVIDLGLVEKPEIYFKSANQFKQALLSVL